MSRKGISKESITLHPMGFPHGPQPGKYEDSDVVDVIKKYEEVSKKVDKPMGYHIIEPNHKLVLEKIKNGYTFIAFSLDILFLGTICREEMNFLRRSI